MFNLKTLKLKTTSTVVNIILSLYLVIFTNGPFWNRLSSFLGTTTADWIFLVMTGLGIFLILNLLLSLFSFKSAISRFL